MSVIDTLTDRDKGVLAELFEEAADDIVEFGWKNNADQLHEDEYSKDDYVTAPRCIWLAVSYAADRFSLPHTLSPEESPVLFRLVEEQLVVDDLTYVFEINDNYPVDEGQAWAYGELRMISEKLKSAIAHVPSAEKATVTAETEKTVSGNITDATSLLKRFTNWCTGK